MKTNLMNSVEVAYAATNIKNIEDALGYNIPAGLVNVTDLGDHIMDSHEVATAAMNIRYVMRSLEGRGNRKSTSKIDKFLDYFELASVLVPAVVGAIAVICALIFF